MKRSDKHPNTFVHLLVAVTLVFAQACSEAPQTESSNQASISKTEASGLSFYDPDEVMDNPGHEIVEPGGAEEGIDGETEGEPDIPLVDQIIEDSSACVTLASQVEKLDGQNYSFNGAKKSLAIENANRVSINGATQNLYVGGSKSIELNGFHSSVCLVSSHFKLNGSYGKSGEPIVLIGQGSMARVDVINGGKFSDVVLVNIKDIGTINGNSNDIYIFGGNVKRINGRAKNIHIMNGARVELINGNFKNVFVEAGSVLEKRNGS